MRPKRQFEKTVEFVVSERGPNQRPSPISEDPYVEDDSPRDLVTDLEDEDLEDGDVLTVDPRDTIPIAGNSFVVHGNWCGPGWTGGLKVTATDYDSHGGDWDYPAIDRLDAACRDHDKACVGGCETKDDLTLAKEATLAGLPEALGGDPDVPKEKAAFVAGGMVVSAAFDNEDSPLEKINPLKPRGPDDILDAVKPVKPLAPLVDPDGPGLDLHNEEKGLGWVISKATNVLDDVVSSKTGRNLLGVAKPFVRVIPYVGSYFDYQDIKADEKKHGKWSQEAWAARGDFVVNLFPPTGFANDVYSIATGNDGVVQSALGDPE
jgi:hypothetical protein